MAYATLEEIEAELLARVAAVPSLVDSLDHEPKSLPRVLPVATLLYLGPEPRQAETGPADDVEHRWRLSVYFSLSDWRAAQVELKATYPLVLKALRPDPTLGGLVDFTRLADETEPIFNPEDGWLRKSVRVTVVQTED